MQITDRAKDMVKSGGEWISAIKVENLAMGYEAAAVATVPGVAHPKWDDPSIFLCQLRPAVSADATNLRACLIGKIASLDAPRRAVRR